MIANFIERCGCLARHRAGMNSTWIVLAAALAMGAGTGDVRSQTINWGTPMFSDIVDSKGNVLSNSYVFELGAFANGFTPQESNIEDWISNWKTFSIGNYNGIENPVDDGISGYVTSVAQMLPDGSSQEMPPEEAFDFQNLNAFLWIRNWDAPVPGAEWLLTRADNWVFPVADPDCGCLELPFEWSTSDLTALNVPLWGSQNGYAGQEGTAGPGEFTVTGPYTLQTFTFVPEPSAAMLVGLGVAAVALRRRRTNCR
jgi:hypothetical protein